jgi:hypothetical protein
MLTLAWGLRDKAYGFAGGTGEPNDPYQIATIEDLLAVGSSNGMLSKHYVLVNDLDLDPNLPGGRVFDDALIALDSDDKVNAHSGSSFDGVFDGQGYAIRNLHVSGRDGYDAGLFGTFSGLVKDLNLLDVRISGSPCGAIAGLNQRGMILRCSVTGQVSGTEDVGGVVGVLWNAHLMGCRAEVQVTGDKNTGGLVGGGLGGTLIQCRARVQIQGGTNVGGLTGGGTGGEYQIFECRVDGTIVGVNNAGGLAGGMWAATILQCAVDCEIAAEQTAGGLIGDGDAAFGAWVMDSYVRGSVTGSRIGGLLGLTSDVSIMNCYAACAMIPVASDDGRPAAVGGLFGDTTKYRVPLVIGSFWDTEVSGAGLSSGDGTQYPGTGLSTDQMQQQATFEQAGWNFASVWAMTEGGYPILQWELALE